MGFINEKIDTPEKIRLFEGLKLVSPITHQPVKPSKWTADAQRGFYLVNLGGGSFEIPLFFVLVVPGGVIELEGRRAAGGNVEAGTAHVAWQITAVRIPRALASQVTGLLSVVREALVANGIYFKSVPEQRVQIELPSPTLV
jgi:hypothetical protein